MHPLLCAFQGRGHLCISVLHMCDQIISKHTLIETCLFDENKDFAFHTKFYPINKIFSKTFPTRIQIGPFFLKQELQVINSLQIS